MNKIFNIITGLIKLRWGTNSKKADTRNPWAGLSSYEDPSRTSHPLKFRGREEDTEALFRQVDDNITVSLYGKSGIGKTSLLNAGVFPLLRENGYFSLYIRFNQSSTQPFAYRIVETLTSRFEDAYGRESIEIIDVIPENTNPESEDFLWSYFARRRFYDTKGNILFPVIILDQFEENIRNSKEASTLLLKQIAYMSNRHNMLNDTIVDETLYVYDYNFRFIISIREDDLYRLEDLINTNYLSILKTGRYRLQNISAGNAARIISDVGDGFLNESELDSITERIITASIGKEDGLIETNTISLICSRLFDLTIKEGKDRISLSDVESYTADSPFEEYYDAATKRLSEREKRFIETNMVSPDGRRNSIPEEKIKGAVKSYEALISGETPILRRNPASSGDDSIELIHDGLCNTVLKNQTVRLERKNRTILSLWLFIFSIAALWMINTSIVADFAYLVADIFFHSRTASPQLPDIFSIFELALILIYPLATGALIYDYKKKTGIAYCLLSLLLIPCCLFPGQCLTYLHNAVNSVSYRWNHEGLDGMMAITDKISGSLAVFITYALTSLILCLLNGFGRPGIRGTGALLKILWKSFSVRLYLTVIAAFLFWSSLSLPVATLQSETSDTSWGITVIPMLVLALFGTGRLNNRAKYALYSYLAILITLTICAICEVIMPVDIRVISLIAAFIVLIAYFHNFNLLNACIKSACCITILAIVMLMQMGYNPFALDGTRIFKVYPWKTVIAKDSTGFGVYDARYGDTLLIPRFGIDSTYIFFTVLPENGYTDTLTTSREAYPEHSFPLRITKTSDGKWKLSLLNHYRIEHNISHLAHSNATDSIELSNIEGARLFIRLRNDICDFCISGNDSILMADIPYIYSYETILHHNLKHSLKSLSANASAMTESEIIPFIRALTRSFYMNMLKEAILRCHYNKYISSFSCYYVPTVLTELHVNWGMRFISKYNISLTTAKGVASENTYTDILLSGYDLYENLLFAWNRLFTALYMQEFASYAPTLASSINNVWKENNLLIDNLTKNMGEMREKLYETSAALEIANHKADTISSILKSVEPDKNDLNNMVNVIRAYLETQTLTNNITREFPNEMKQSVAEIDSLSSSFLTIALHQADAQFKILITDTFRHLLDIIMSNDTNPYNGALISICQGLYLTGAVREYDMASFEEKLDSAENRLSAPGYKFVRQAMTEHKNLSHRMDSISIIEKSFNGQVTKLLDIIGDTSKHRK